MQTILFRLICLCACLTLAACGPGGTGSVDTVQKEEHRITADETVTMLRVKIESLNSSPWERVLILRKGMMAGLTPLMRMTRLTCPAPQQCRITILPPGTIWPQSYAVDPARFFISDYKITDTDKPGRNFSNVIDADNILDRRPGFSPISDFSNEAALMRDFIAREFPHVMPYAVIGFALTALAFCLLWCCGFAIRLLWPQSAFTASLRRWPFSRTVPMIAYAIAALIFVLQFTIAMTAGEYVGTGKYQLMFGPKADVLIGKAGIEPLLMLIAMLAGIAAFQIIAAAARGFAGPGTARI